MPSQCRRERKEDRKELECELLSFKTNTVVSSVGKRNGVQYEKGSIIFYCVLLEGKAKLKMKCMVLQGHTK
jgi:hypothetical protein